MDASQFWDSEWIGSEGSGVAESNYEPLHLQSLSAS
jgi:hypothetical protein